MKLRNAFYIVLLVAIGISGMTGCSKSAFDINKNPNAPTDSTITYNLLLPAALQTTSSIVESNWTWLQNWLGYWARSGTYAPNVIEETYQITTNFQTGVWDNLYANAFNYDIMQKKAQVAGASYYEAIGRIMKAHNFQILVDVYNNIPYFEALQGNANPTPIYDKGLDVYTDLFKQIDTAVSLMQTFSELDHATATLLNVDYETNDLVYHGDPVKWIRFGNTLKLRMLVHLYKVSGFNANAEVAKINATSTITGGQLYIGSGMIGSGETVQINPGFNSTKPNPYYRFYVRDETATATANSVYSKANEYAIEYYAYDGDPRIARFYTAGNQGYRGVAYGLPPVAENVAATLSGVNGPGLLPGNGYDAPAWIFTTVESFFLQSEALERGIITGSVTAGEMLTMAIQESFVTLGLASTDADTYISNNASFPDVDYYAPGGGINTIISQKWFALNGIATFEVWTDYRRVDYDGEDHYVYGVVGGFDPGPSISVAPQNTATEIPIRLLYPQNEYNYNAENVGAEGTPDQFTSKIFWDTK